jgi:beta-lactamase superfamily II metal-dependent hydrolase
VVGNFQVGEFWHGRNPLTPSYQDLLEQVTRRGITIREVAAGDRFERAGTSVWVLWPLGEQKANTLNPPKLNGEEQAITEFGDLGRQRAELISRVPAHDDSLVMRISNGEASVLLPGEISGKVEQELLRSGFPLQARTLQVPHSGSKNSSSMEFLEQVSPRVALSSAEGGTRFDQQNSDAIERLRKVGAQIYGTDLYGAVTVEMQAGSILVHTYRASPTE